MSRSYRLQQHYERIWHQPMRTCAFSRGPVHELPAAFEVVCAPPHEERQMWTYATAGLSVSDGRQPIELHIFSPKESMQIVDLLFVVAHFHHTGPGLNWAHTVNFGRPWLGSSLCDHGLLSRPYLDGPNLEHFQDADGMASCYWLIPITACEVRFKAAHGIEKLEDEFERQGFDYLDPERQSVLRASNDE